MIDPASFAASLAGHGLGGTRPLPARLGPDDAIPVIASAARANLLGLLGNLVAAGAIEATASVSEQIHRAAVDRLVSDMRLERASAALVERLAAKGIAVRVLKGLATSHLDHPDPSHRSTSDVDLLVRGRDIRSALEIVGALGYQRDLPERRPGFDARYAKDITLFAPRRPELDLHRTLIKGPFGLALDPDRAFEDGEPLALAGTVDAVALSAPWRLLHSCLVVGAGDREPSMGMLRDLVLQARRPGLDHAAFRRLVDSTRSAPVVTAALARVQDCLAIELPVLVDDDGTRRWWLRTYAAHGGTDVTAQVAGAAALPWRHRGPYLWALARPTRQYRQERSAAGRASTTRLLRSSLPRRARHREDQRARTG